MPACCATLALDYGFRGNDRWDVDYPETLYNNELCEGCNNVEGREPTCATSMGSKEQHESKEGDDTDG